MGLFLYRKSRLSAVVQLCVAPISIGVGIVGLGVAPPLGVLFLAAGIFAIYSNVRFLRRAPESPPPTGPAVVAGMRVAVAWTDGQSYPAIVQAVQGAHCLAAFPDGQQRWVPLQQLRFWKV